jgi:TolA-binding protein
VSVSEGVVVVRAQGAEARVAAGEVWPACTDPEPPVASAAHPTTTGSSGGAAPPAHPSASIVSAPEPKPSSHPSKDPSDPGSSSLAEENALFQAGLTQKRAGDAPSAIATFEALVRKHPKSPLAESAHVERMRLLANHRDPRARAAAKEYLSRYPKGYARGEAMDLIGP